MYLQFDRDYPHHATIISKIENGMIYYAAHTNSREEEPLSNFFKENRNGKAYKRSIVITEYEFINKHKFSETNECKRSGKKNRNPYFFPKHLKNILKFQVA